MKNGKLQKNPPFGSIAYPPKIGEPTTLWAVGSLPFTLLCSCLTYLAEGVSILLLCD